MANNAFASFHAQSGPTTVDRQLAPGAVTATLTRAWVGYDLSVTNTSDNIGELRRRLK